MFISHTAHYAKNLLQAGTYAAQPAILSAPGGNQEPAVVLFKTRQITGVLPAAEALRLANEIADALGAHPANVGTN